MSLAKRARKYTNVPTSLNIVEFAESKQGLGLELFPAQKFVLKIFDKLPLDDVEKNIEIKDKFNENVMFTLTEAEYYQYLLDEGRISLPYEKLYENEIIQFLLAVGRRGTKSTTISIWAAHKLYQVLNIYHPQEYFKILPRDPMNITMTALGESNANKLFAKFINIIKHAPFFNRFLREPASVNQLKVWTQFDLDNLENQKSGAHTQSINIYALPNTMGVRGDNNIFVIMDEFAHFAQSSKSTKDKPMDEAIYEALIPSVSGFRNPDGSSFGKTLILSSPSGEVGKFFSEFKAAFDLGADSGTLAIQAPSWELNPYILPAYLRTAFNKSPSLYEVEYEAKFSKGGLNWIRNLSSFYTCCDVRLNPLCNVGVVSTEYFLGADFALSNDGIGLAVSHFDPKYEEVIEGFPNEAFLHNPELEEIFEGEEIRYKGRYVFDRCEVRYAGKGPWEDRKVIHIDDALDWIEDIYKRFLIRYGIFDQWSGVIIEQMVKKRAIPRFEMITHTEMINDSQYKLFMMMLNQEELKIPFEKSIVLELLNLKEEIRRNGIIKVEAPPGGNFHDDLFDAMIRSLYLCHSYRNRNKVVAKSIPKLFSKLSLNLGKASKGLVGGLRSGSSQRQVGRNRNRSRVVLTK